ncbi:hypothetical protein AAG570_014136 [Ranatra chinensis]|uniref:Uncharacterized protein n=1 Tax=Ranatra chinensis TaxID=642074 RepID=A0ABD0XTA6_9HEMI
MATTGLLPYYQRFLNGAPVAASSRRSFRPREKYLIVLVFFTFGVVCFGAFFFLPEFKAGGTVNSVYSVYKQMQEAGPQLLLPGREGAVLHDLSRPGEDPHRLRDRAKFFAKIREDPEVVERPRVVSSRSQATGAQPPPEAEPDPGGTPLTVPPASALNFPGTQGGHDSDPVARARRDKVLEVSVNYDCFIFRPLRVEGLLVNNGDGNCWRTTLGLLVCCEFDKGYIFVSLLTDS